MKFFVDTSAFIALEDRSDQHHSMARRFYEELTGRDRLFTNNYVLDETITRLRYTIGHEAASGFADIMLGSQLYAILYVDQEMEKAALAVFKRYRDKKLSFTDCASMAMVQAEKLDAFFAFDNDFVAAGFRVAPPLL